MIFSCLIGGWDDGGQCQRAISSDKEKKILTVRGKAFGLGSFALTII